MAWSYRRTPRATGQGELVGREGVALAEWRMRFWTADLHLSHTRILELCPLRPWNNPEAMNRGLVDRWNQVVGPEDEVWVVGDFAMGRIHESLRWVPLRNVSTTLRQKTA